MVVEQVTWPCEGLQSYTVKGFNPEP